jgi:hypothetical protein
LAGEQAEYEAKMAAREAQTKARGKKPGGKPPAPSVAGPEPSDQINLTDGESRIMPVAGGGFEQCYNAQAAVTDDSLLVIATDVVQAANDKQQVEPMLGQPQTLLGDNGYFSAAKVVACAAAGLAPLLAPGRTPHHPSLDERFAAAPPALDNPTPLAAMLHRLATPDGKKLYVRRKHTPEPVFGIIKSVLGFRQFLLRGLDKVRGEWRLVTMARNIEHKVALRPRRSVKGQKFHQNHPLACLPAKAGGPDRPDLITPSRRRQRYTKPRFSLSSENLQSDRLLGPVSP